MAHHDPCCGSHHEVEDAPLVWVGSGRGDYEEQKKVEFVGSGKGSYKKGVVPQSRYVLCLWMLLFIVVLIAAIVLLVLFQPKAAKPQEKINKLDTNFNCNLPSLGAPLAGAFIVEESWASLDVGGTGLVKKSSLGLWQAQGLFSSKAAAALMLLAADGNGNIDNNGYVEALKSADLPSAAKLTDDELFVRAAWVVSDKNLDEFITRTEMGLMQPEGLLKADIERYLFGADTDMDDRLSGKEFTQGLSILASQRQGALQSQLNLFIQKYWTGPKKAYCCATQGVGCLIASTSILPSYDCKTSGNSTDSWTEMHRAYCCSRYHITCPGEVVVPFDCDAGYASWERLWTQEKRDWCCFHADRACPFTTPEPYDCQAGLSQWKLGWSDAKKKWCCQNKALGCSLSFDCGLGYDDWQLNWSPMKRSWCCDKVGRGCVIPTTDAPKPIIEPAAGEFDCYAGFNNWWAGWSKAKKAWCCKNFQRGCEQYSATALYDCQEGYTNRTVSWTRTKALWCCNNKQLGCDLFQKWDVPK